MEYVKNTFWSALFIGRRKLVEIGRRVRQIVCFVCMQSEVRITFLSPDSKLNGKSGPAAFPAKLDARPDFAIDTGQRLVLMVGLAIGPKAASQARAHVRVFTAHSLFLLRNVIPISHTRRRNAPEQAGCTGFESVRTAGSLRHTIHIRHRIPQCCRTLDTATERLAPPLRIRAARRAISGIAPVCT